MLVSVWLAAAVSLPLGISQFLAFLLFGISARWAQRLPLSCALFMCWFLPAALLYSTGRCCYVRKPLVELPDVALAWLFVMGFVVGVGGLVLCRIEPDSPAKQRNRSASLALNWILVAVCGLYGLLFTLLERLGK